MQTQEADGWSLRCLINPKGIGKRMIVDRQKVTTKGPPPAPGYSSATGKNILR
jgi:hypothetical protein